MALAFVGRPRLVLLDEPTTGLDVEARHVLWQAVRDFATGGGTVLLSSHYLEEVETLAERVVVLRRGRVLADDRVEDVRRAVALQRVRLHAPHLPPLPAVVQAQTDAGAHDLLTPDADELVRELVHSGAAFSGLEVRPTSLEEAFLALTIEPGRHR